MNEQKENNISINESKTSHLSVSSPCSLESPPKQGDLEGPEGLDSLFFELLQVATGNRSGLSVSPTAEQWEQLREMAKKQALNGVAYAAMERLPQEQWPDRYFRLRWGGQIQKTIDRNKELNVRCEEVTHRFQYDGFWCCILKGQGNLYNYPEWLKDKRAPGDIDVWVVRRPSGPSKSPCLGGLPDEHGENTDERGDQAIAKCLPKQGGLVGLQHPIRDVVDFCQHIKKADKVGYIHLDFNVWKTVDIEVHIRPSFLCSPLRNRRLQKYFLEQQPTVAREDTKFPLPNNEFNAVYQLMHIYKHLFEEGIGLRQLLDYYFVLTNLDGSASHEQIMKTLKSFATDKFAGAVMYVLGVVFAGSTEQAYWMLCKPDKKRGEHLLNEVMLAGNFGHYDERNGDLANEGHAGRYWRKTKRAFRLMSLYPHEAIWQPYFMVYHMLWRGLKLWRWE